MDNGVQTKPSYVSKGFEKVNEHILLLLPLPGRYELLIVFIGHHLFVFLFELGSLVFLLMHYFVRIKITVEQLYTKSVLV